MYYAKSKKGSMKSSVRKVLNACELSVEEIAGKYDAHLLNVENIGEAIVVYLDRKLKKGDIYKEIE
jgi:hypothetical protein